ncbi:hypothetical protein Ddc_09509 [Ditylenchus destructor]|nr:hypothetical protein Ddc_09509 [Ditylenchus destructor]
MGRAAGNIVCKLGNQQAAEHFPANKGHSKEEKARRFAIEKKREFSRASGTGSIFSRILHDSGTQLATILHSSILPFKCKVEEDHTFKCQ